MSLPSAGFQTRIVLSVPAVASLVPSRLDAKAATGPLLSNPSRRGDWELPEPSQPVRAGRDELLIVGEICQAERALGRRLDHAVGCQVDFPEADGVRLIAGRELCSVAAPGSALHVARVAFEVLDGLTRGEVPDLDRLAGAPRRTACRRA